MKKKLHIENNFNYEEGVSSLKSIISNMKYITYCILICLIQFETVNGQTGDNEGNNNDNINCGLDNTFTFGLSLSYVGVSLLTLIGVSLWSFKMIPGFVISSTC